MTAPLDGIFIPAATPFDADGDLRLDWFAGNLRRWGATSVRGIMVLGTNGEFRSVNDTEARAIIDCASENIGDKTLIAGAGRESTRLTVDFIQSLTDLRGPLHYVSVLPPHYFKGAMTADALRQHYVTVADNSPFPVLIYVAPSYANGLVVPPSLVGELAEHPNIAGIKDTSTDQMTSYMLAAGGRDDFAVMAGSLNTLLTCLQFGGPGGIVSAANYFPEACARITELYASEGPDAAIAQFRALQALIKVTGGRQGVASVKACMNLLGYEAGVPRAPVRPMPGEAAESMRAHLDAAPHLSH